MGRRQYSDNDKATALAALDANGGNVNKTANMLGIPASTLTEWRDGRVNPEVTEVRGRKKEELAGRLVEIAHLLIDAMPDKIKDSNLQQAATTLGITVEKIQLLDGKATERKELTGKDGGAIETRVSILSELSDDELDNLIAGNPPSQRGKGTTPLTA